MSSHFSEKASKGSFLKPDNVQNHSNEGQGKKKERGEDKKAMVALLVFIMARAIMALYNGYFGDSFWLKKTVGRKKLGPFNGANVFKKPARGICENKQL